MYVASDYCSGSSGCGGSGVPREPEDSSAAGVQGWSESALAASRLQPPHCSHVLPSAMLECDAGFGGLLAPLRTGGSARDER